ncbi:hypothetical protein [Novosphingobium terrae]|uniref:hypothetical protein n=1 Tax=Novosphingobium terrae TaxID=2726189 RepID=UPI001F138A83|nr:hypothetical protein [Novosphingobium terrae]
MRFLLSLAMLAGAALAVPALAQDAPAAAASSAKAAKPKKICRADTSLGSVMPRYVCHSKEEWASIDKANQSAADGALNGAGPSLKGPGT